MCIHCQCLQVVEELVSNVGVIEKLTFFEHKDANGKDWGLNVRQRAKELVALVNDPERMRAERQKVSQSPGMRLLLQTIPQEPSVNHCEQSTACAECCACAGQGK